MCIDKQMFSKRSVLSRVNLDFSSKSCTEAEDDYFKSHFGTKICTLAGNVAQHALFIKCESAIIMFYV